MAVVIRRTPKPTVIQRSRPRGAGWPLRPGYPYEAGKNGWHLIEIEGMSYTFLWRAYEERWDTGLEKYSPEKLGEHLYRGICYPVFKAPPSDKPDQWRRRR